MANQPKMLNNHIPAVRLYGWHLDDDEYFYLGDADDASIRWDNTNSRLAIEGNVYFKNDVTIAGNLTFGDASIDTLILKGRVATMSAAGSQINIDATYTYSELWEIKSKVTSWTGVGTSFTGQYFRTENQSASASEKELHAVQVYAADYSAQIASGNGISLLHGILVDLLVKPGNATASNNITIGSATAGEFCFSPEAVYGSETITITTRASCLQLTPSSNNRITGGNLAKIHGLYMLVRDGDGGSTKLGSGIEIVSDPSQSGTRTLTTGFLLTIGATTGIALNGAMTTGLSITGACTDGIKIDTGAMTDGIEVASACGAYGLNISGTATTAGVAVSGSAGIGFSVLTGTFTTGLSLAGVMSDSAISIAPPSGTTALGLTFASGTITTAINIASTTATGIAIGACTTYGISFTGATTATGISFAGTVTTGILFSAITTTGINFGVAPTTTGIGMVGASSYLGLRIGNFHTTAAGSGVIVSNTVKRTVDILCDDNGVGTVEADFISSARFRLMGTGASYAGEAYALHGLFKYSPVTTCTTASYTAGILGAFEWATNLTITGGAHGAIIGRVGGDAAPAISAGATMASFIAGANWLSANNHSGSGSSVGFAVATFSTGTWDYGLAINDSSCTTGIHVGNTTTAMSLAGTATTGISFTANKTTNINFVSGTTTTLINAAAAAVANTTRGIFLGVDQNTVGGGIPLKGASWATAQGNALYCDDGGVALVGYTEAFTVRMLTTIAVTTGDVSTAAMHPDLYLNANYTGTGDLSSIWGNTTIAAGATVNTSASLGDVGGATFGIDIAGTLAASSFACGCSVGASITGTKTGILVGYRIRNIVGAGNWDGAFSFPADNGITQAAAAGATLRYLRVYEAGVLYTIAMATA